MKKQKRKWTTKDGTKISICDMSEEHIDNSMRLMERKAKAQIEYSLEAALDTGAMLQGEMAIDTCDGDIEDMQYSLDDVSSWLWENNKTYRSMAKDKIRREENSYLLSEWVASA